MNGIGRRINEALDKLRTKDYENALIQVSIAIDATAKREFPELSDGIGAVGKRCKRLIKKNKELLMLAMTRSIDCEIFFGKSTLDEIIYHMVRSSLIHDAELPATISIDECTRFSYLNNKITISYTLIPALILCVVGSPTNSSEQVASAATLKIYEGVTFDINSFFGKKEEMIKALRTVFANQIIKKMPGKIILENGTLAIGTNNINL